MMKKWILPVLLLSATACFAEEPLPLGPKTKPAEAVAWAEALLEQGESSQVLRAAEGMALSRPAVANLLRSCVELYAGNTAGALQALENTEKPDAWTVSRKKFLSDRFALEADMETVRSDLVLLRLPKRDAFLSEKALPALEGSFENAAAVFGVRASTPVIVEVFPEADAFSRFSGAPIGDIERLGLFGVVRHGRILLLSPRSFPEGIRWLEELSRQHNRLTLSRMGGTPLPGWLLEGLAKRYESFWRTAAPSAVSPADADSLARAALVNPSTGTLLLPWSSLDSFPRAVKNQDESRLALLEAADAVATLIPAGQIIPLLDSFRRGDPAALSLIPGFSRGGGLEKTWQSSLESRSWVLSEGAIPARVSLSPSTLSAVLAPEARPLYAQAAFLSGAARWKEALPLFKKISALAPDNGAALTLQAEALLALEDAPSAEPLLRRAVQKNPAYAPAFAALGGLLYEDGRYDEAQTILQEGLEANPFHPRLHEYLGLIAVDVANIPAARRFLSVALSLDPSRKELRDILRGMPK